VSIRSLVSSRPARILWPVVPAAALALAGWSATAQIPAGDATAQLFVRGLEDIRELYVEPVAIREIALSGAAQLRRFDGKIAVTDHLAGGPADTVTLLYEDRDAADFAMPANNDAPGWGALIARLTAAAELASPSLAATPPEGIDDAVLDGITAALDPFSRYVGPKRARDDRAARNGFGGIGVAAEPTVTTVRAGGILVLRISGFNRSTTRRVADALSDGRRERGGRPAGIVLDLRGNPGGLLDQAVGLADLFIRAGPIVSTVGRAPASDQYFAASGGAIAPHVPLAVLINGGSASAAEIVAAALQDAGRAVVIGSSSYGKGTVQTVLRLPNDGELILTWARLVAPSGYRLQSHGVVPTLCSALLPETASPPAVLMQQAAAVAFAATPRPRAALNDTGWAALLRSCPPRPTRPAVDLELAERLLANPSLYAAALHALPAVRSP
jgi:Peptidase family S41